MVYAVHPPGEGLHLASLKQAPASASVAGVLLTLAQGQRLFYMLCTGIGWRDLAYNLPVGVRALALLACVQLLWDCIP